MFFNLEKLIEIPPDNCQEKWCSHSLENSNIKSEINSVIILDTLHIICSFLYLQEYTMSSIYMLWLLALSFFGTPNGKSRHGFDSFTCSWVPFTQIGLPCPWGYEDFWLFYCILFYPFWLSLGGLLLLKRNGRRVDLKKRGEAAGAWRKWGIKN